MLVQLRRYRRRINHIERMTSHHVIQHPDLESRVLVLLDQIAANCSDFDFTGMRYHFSRSKEFSRPAANNKDPVVPIKECPLMFHAGGDKQRTIGYCSIDPVAQAGGNRSAGVGLHASKSTAIIV